MTTAPRLLRRLTVLRKPHSKGVAGNAPFEWQARFFSSGAQRPVYLAGQGIVPITRKKGASIRSKRRVEMRCKSQSHDAHLFVRQLNSVASIQLGTISSVFRVCASRSDPCLI